MKIEKKDFLRGKKAQKTFGKKIKPLFGNNRSFSCVSTVRKWKNNKKKVKIGKKSYILTPRIFKTISKQLKTYSEE